MTNELKFQFFPHPSHVVVSRLSIAGKRATTKRTKDNTKLIKSAPNQERASYAGVRHVGMSLIRMLCT